MKYYSAIIKNKVLIHATTNTILENINAKEKMLLYSHKTIYCIIPTCELSRIGKCIATEIRLAFT